MVPFTNFKRVLESLSSSEFTAFVIELWKARGQKVLIEENVFIAKSNVRKTNRIYIIHTNDLPKETEIKSVDPDIIVSHTEDGRMRRIANQFDARFIGPKELHELILYAIDQKRREKLLKAFFVPDIHKEQQFTNLSDKSNNEKTSSGDEQSNTSPNPVTNSTDRFSDYDSGVGNSYRSAVTSPVRIVLVGILIGTIVLMGMGWVGPGISSFSNESGQLESGAPAQAIDEYPVGIDQNGITNLTAVASTHQSLLRNQSYSLEVFHNGSRGFILTSRRWEKSHQIINFNNYQDYNYRVTGSLPPRIIGESSRNISFIEHVNGSVCRQFERNYSEIELHGDSCQINKIGNRKLHAGQFGRASLLRYLDTTHSFTQVIRTGNGLEYQVIATGTPSRLTDDVKDYHAVASFNQSGIVLELDVKYTVQRNGGLRTVTFEFKYTNIGKRKKPNFIQRTLTSMIGN